MDIDLLSKMVKELILDDDRVVLPGLGCFVAEVVPASFSDKGYTINPPYRRLYFRSRPDDGHALVDFYAESNNLDNDVAEKIIRDFLQELKSILHVKKVVVFPGLGRLRATKENNLFFVADEDLDIYPTGFGLEPISLKTHQETKEEVSAAVAGLKSMLQDTVATEPVALKEPEESVAPVGADEQPAETAVSQESEQQEALSTEQPEIIVAPATTEPEMQPELPQSTEVPEEPAEPEIYVMPAEPEVAAAPEKRRVLLKIVIGILILLIVLVVAYMLVGRLCPEWIDQFLYTQDELDILKR